MSHTLHCDIEFGLEDEATSIWSQIRAILLSFSFHFEIRSRDNKGYFMRFGDQDEFVLATSELLLQETSDTKGGFAVVFWRDYHGDERNIDVFFEWDDEKKDGSLSLSISSVHARDLDWDDMKTWYITIVEMSIAFGKTLTSATGEFYWSDSTFNYAPWAYFNKEPQTPDPSRPFLVYRDQRLITLNITEKVVFNLVNPIPVWTLSGWTFLSLPEEHS